MADLAACAAALKSRQLFLARLRKLSELDRLWREPSRRQTAPNRRREQVMQLDSFRTLGRSGLRISPLTLGTMIFGDSS